MINRGLYARNKTFKSFHQLKKWIKENCKYDMSKTDFEDTSKRDIYGDFIIPTNNKKSDIIVKAAGDFMLYFDSPDTNEVFILLCVSFSFFFKVSADSSLDLSIRAAI